MLNKLSLRNAKRSIREYIIYILTLTVIAALMFAFNSMIFSKDISKIYHVAGIMAAMIGLASFFILLIVIWLIHYMVRFMLEKRSKEFGTYLLLGINKKQILKMFVRENLIMSIVAFVFGILPGIFIQQVLTTVFYSLYGKAYHFTLDINIWTFVMTISLYAFAVFYALHKNRKQIKGMKIYDLMYLDKQNEIIKDSNNTGKKWMFFAGILYVIVFHVLLFTKKFNLINSWPLIAGYIVTIYLLYIGLAAFIASYVKNKKNGIFHKTNLFLLRQMSSKIKTMQITMGTISILFMSAIFGCTISMMFNDYIDNKLEKDLAFDLIAICDQPNDDFEELLSTIHKEVQVEEDYKYNVYTDETNKIHQYLFKNYSYFKGKHYTVEKDEKEAKEGSNYYFDHDTYLSLTDYNHLLKIMGREQISLKKNQYFVNAKPQLESCIKQFPNTLSMCPTGVELQYAGLSTESFAQSGHNGADYIIIVPDEIASQLKPYYSLLAAKIKGNVPDNLERKLNNQQGYIDDEDVFQSDNIVWGTGTSQVFSYAQPVIVKKNAVKEAKFVITTITFPLVYIALVFLCVALTIMSVQQLSDSTKYKFRYQVLSKLGLNDSEVDRVVLKQLLFYYMCPFIIAVALSVVIAIYLSKLYVYYTGMHTPVYQYYGLSVGVFLFVYIIYFIVTYVEFKRNIHSKKH